MNKTRLAVGITSALLLVNIARGAISAQDVPPEYAGLTNPFDWHDAQASEAGRSVYERSCLGCHGATGNGVPHAGLGTADFGDHLEESPAQHFWILSEGRIETGMPAYKGSLSEEQRWQVLTYLRSLGEESPPTTSPPPDADAGTLTLAAPARGRAGEGLPLTATLRDTQGQPVRNAPVRFFILVDFFASGPMDIGGADTDQNGVAVLTYVPGLSGERQIMARYQSAEARTSVTLEDPEQPLYQPEAGMKLPSWGPRVFVGPASAMGLGAMGEAPTSALYLPGGLFSWLLLVIAAIVLVWSSYFRVMLQIMGIPIARDVRNVDTKLVPKLGLIYVLTLGTILVLMLATGPNSHWHLLH